MLTFFAIQVEVADFKVYIIRKYVVFFADRPLLPSCTHANCNLGCSIHYSRYRTQCVSFSESGIVNAPIRITSSFDHDYWVDYRNHISG